MMKGPSFGAFFSTTSKTKNMQTALVLLLLVMSSQAFWTKVDPEMASKVFSERSIGESVLVGLPEGTVYSLDLEGIRAYLANAAPQGLSKKVTLPFPRFLVRVSSFSQN